MSRLLLPLPIEIRRLMILDVPTHICHSLITASAPHTRGSFRFVSDSPLHPQADVRNCRVESRSKYLFSDVMNAPSFVVQLFSALLYTSTTSRVKHFDRGELNARTNP